LGECAWVAARASSLCDLLKLKVELFIVLGERGRHLTLYKMDFSVLAILNVVSQCDALSGCKLTREIGEVKLEGGAFVKGSCVIHTGS
jgi:hypothetical protein